MGVSVVHQVGVSGGCVRWNGVLTHWASTAGTLRVTGPAGLRWLVREGSTVETIFSYIMYLHRVEELTALHHMLQHIGEAVCTHS